MLHLAPPIASSSRRAPEHTQSQTAINHPQLGRAHPRRRRPQCSLAQSCSELNSDPRRTCLHEPSGPPFESSEEPSSAMRAVVSETCVRGKPLQRRKALKLSGG